MNTDETRKAAGCGTMIGFAVIAAVASMWIGFFTTCAVVLCLRMMGVQ